LLGDTVVSVREFCSVLRPATLDYAGLVPAIETVLGQFERRNGVKARFEHAEFDGRCTPQLESALFRIVQEALLNSAKHAHARTVRVSLQGTPDRLRLAVEDDGVGFDPARVGRSDLAAGHGLLNMRERAAFAGATLQVASEPGRGTLVSVQLDRAAAPGGC
jgi:signal transduction histidine kinase